MGGERCTRPGAHQDERILRVRLRICDLCKKQLTSDETIRDRPTYWLTRFVILRVLGGVYAVAFLVAINQVLPLMGTDGLLPLHIFIKNVIGALGSKSEAFIKLPSLFWFNHSDTALLTVSWIGFVLSCIVAAGFANAPVMAIIWFCYMSIVHVGQEWYGYGWEMQLSETGFLAIFLCPLFNMKPFPRQAPAVQVIFLFRWLVFRIMLGAGLIKVRNDVIWTNGTALYYHFETQPIPNPLSRWFHFLPHAVLKAGVWYNHLAELVAPWFVFWPRVARHVAGVVIILFQLTIFASGNLSFLNIITIVPALACLDDGFWSKLLPHFLVRRAMYARDHAVETRPMKVTAWIVTGVIAMLSIQPAVNLLSPRQIMNTSFDPLDLVNTYGAFGTVGKERYNVVFEGTSDNDSTDNATWRPYIYKGLPVLTDKRPPQIAPYHLRFDWQMWFASMSSPQDYPWVYNLIYKMLHNDRRILSLFAQHPFQNKPPMYVRAVLYRYKFAAPGNPTHQYWQRERLGLWIPPLSASDPALINFLKGQEWLY